MFRFVLGLCLAGAVSAPSWAEEPVRFAVFGDIQDERPEGHEFDLELAAMINAAEPDFTVFIGDIQGGGPCTDQQRIEARAVFDTLEHPLIFTPGDNAWTDCNLRGKGDFSPIERLDRLREDLLGVGESLGQTRISLAQQSDRGFPENAIWEQGGVVFVTIHVPGSNNGLYPDRYAFEEYEARNAANLDWLQSAYDRVRESNALGLAVFFHANPGWDEIYWQANAYRDVKQSLAVDAAELGVPVLVSHGDTHRFTIDKPLAFLNARTRADHLTRLEVFGAPEGGFVIVTADPRNPELFAFTAVEQDRRHD